jgi:glycerol uptake facilitator-like aquaporin
MTGTPIDLKKAAAAEFLGTAMLLCVVIGSGIMAERLSGGNVAVALLGNTFATVFALVVLIETLGPISGAHFNPVVTVLMSFQDKNQHLPSTNRALIAIIYIAAQLLGAAAGAALANLMFDLQALHWATKLRGGWGQWLGEFLATAALLFVIVRSASSTDGLRTSVLVGCTVGAGYWFTSSTSFANPAAVFGRMFSDSFAGIAPASALPFVAAQMLGGTVGFATAKWINKTQL